jgi:hypothetical protein
VPPISIRRQFTKAAHSTIRFVQLRRPAFEVGGAVEQDRHRPAGRDRHPGRRVARIHAGEEVDPGVHVAPAPVGKAESLGEDVVEARPVADPLRLDGDDSPSAA